MADSSTTSRPYAVAVFRLAQEEGELGRWSEMLALLALVAQDATVKGLFASPKVNPAQLADLIVDVCGDRLSKTGANFVRVLASNRRLGILADVRAGFEEERAKVEGRSQVMVSSPYPLADAQRDQIRSAMARRLGTEVDLTEETDETLIGGVMIRAGDLVIDLSLRGRLQSLGQSLG